MLDYLTENQTDKIICLEVLEMKDRKFNNKPVTNELYHGIMQKYPNTRLEFYNIQDLINYATEYHETTDKYSFHYPADTYNLLNTLLDLGVSDILLTEPFVFDIETISNYIRYNHEDCKIHIRPYLGKPSYMSRIESIMTHFWVLPQHIYLYEDYIDYIDIFADKAERERRLLDAYCVQHEYNNLLGPFIENCIDKDFFMSAGYVPTELAEYRTHCKQVCITKMPARCHRCHIRWRLMQLIANDYMKNVMKGEPSQLLENKENK